MNIRYFNIISGLCEYYGFKDKDLLQLLKDKDCKYLLLLFLSKYKCMNEEELMKMFDLKNKKSIYSNLRKAEEKLLLNKDFRDKFYDIEGNLLK